MNQPRLLAGVATGLLTAIAVPHSVHPGIRGILAWDAAVIAYLALLAFTMGGDTRHRKLKQNASHEDQGRWVLLTVMTIACFISLAAILTLVSNTKSLPPDEARLRQGLGALTVFASWSLMHMIFAVHYAHHYYGDADQDPNVFSLRGGLIFPHTKEPVFSDFVYYAFVIGMTFQVSDVQVSESGMRRLTLAQGILSFFFNTFILALSVNIAAGLIS